MRATLAKEASAASIVPLDAVPKLVVAASCTFQSASPGWLIPRSTATFHVPALSRFQIETNCPYAGASAGFAVEVSFQGPVERPSSPEPATSTCTGRQSSTIGGSARGDNQARAACQPRGT